jgi:hypothetical protein
VGGGWTWRPERRRRGEGRGGLCVVLLGAEERKLTGLVTEEEGPCGEVMVWEGRGGAREGERKCCVRGEMGSGM